MNWSTPYGTGPGGRRRLHVPALANGVLVKKLSLTAMVLSLVVAMVGGGTWAAFSATTSNVDNSFSTGSVTLTNNLGATAMFAVTDMAPLETAGPYCIEVTYTGSLDAAVTLYGTTDAGGLDAYLDLLVERGATCGAFGTPTQLYSGTLAAYPDGFATGIADSDPTWTSGKVAAYRFTATLKDDSAAQGLDVKQAFTWEARTL